MRELAESPIRSSLLNVPGVAEVVIMGGWLPQYRVTIDPTALRAYGLRLAEVEQAIRRGSENAPGGYISTGVMEYSVGGIGQYNTLADIQNTVITAHDGIPVYLRDIAWVEDGAAPRRGIASKDGKETVVAQVIKQPGADSEKVVQGIKRTLADLRENLPAGVQIVPYYDQTRLIDGTFAGITHAILFGVLLVMLMLYLFLGKLRGAFTVAASLALSVLIAGICMQQLGIGLNILSLGGLAIAAVIMLDAAIIIVEHIYHRHQRGRESDNDENSGTPALQEAIAAGRPIAYATLIIIAVLLPFCWLGGIEGLLFRPLEITTAVALPAVLLLSLTFVPMLSLRLFPSSSAANLAGEVKFVTRAERGYAPLLAWSLAHRWAVMGAAFVLLASSVLGLCAMSKNVMPKYNEGTWVITTVTPPGTSLEENDRISRQIEDLLLNNPNIAGVVRRNGHPERASGSVPAVNAGEFIVHLKPNGRLTKSSARILAELRKEIEEIPAVTASFSQPLPMKLSASIAGTPAPLQVKLLGPDMRVLAEKAAELQRIMQHTRGLTDINVDGFSAIPQVQIQIDRQAAARYGISAGAVSELIRLALGGEELTQVRSNGQDYGVFVRFPDVQNGDLAAIGNLPVDTPTGAAIPLSQVAKITLSTGPNVIRRESMSRQVSINAGIRGRDPGRVIADIKAGIKTMKLPGGYYVLFGGDYQDQQSVLQASTLAAVCALAIIFMLLFLALKSSAQATLVLVTAPSAFIGGVLFLLLSGGTLNVSSAVGFIALFGIVVQNSLLLLTRTNDLVAEGHHREEAIRLASLQRLHPQLLTACCVILGLLPVLLSNGMGVEIAKPFAAVMVGGLLTAALYTLCILPAACLTWENTLCYAQQQLILLRER